MTELLGRLTRIDELVAVADEDARELVGAVLALHREGLARLVEHGAPVDDPVVAALLTLHGLHPDPIEVRIERAIYAARARLGRRCSLEAAIDGDRVRVRVRADVAAPTTVEIRNAIEEAVLSIAPDVAAVDVVVIDARGRCSLPVIGGSAGSVQHRPRCEVCGVPIPEHHGHRAVGHARAPQCACERCADPPSTAVEVALTDEAWDALDVPVGLAFFLRSSSAADVLALYPGPAGLTEAAVSEATWHHAIERSPDLARLAPDVQALVVDRMAGRRRHRIVSADSCYRLAGTLRTAWRGLHGGDAVNAELDRFFREVG